MIPEPVKKILRPLYKVVRPLIRRLYFLVRPPAVKCNLCGWYGKKMVGVEWHPGSYCPICNSEVRQRLFWASVHRPDGLNVRHTLKDKKTLHFAPDHCLGPLLQKTCGSGNYQTADFGADGYSYSSLNHRLDMSAMPAIADSSYDCLIAFDVLEHIPEHLTALKEANRVLRPGGWCIFTVPQKDNLEKTLEDKSITSAEDREKHYGQWDHLRIYGSDFKEMIEAAGFEVTVRSADDFSEAQVKKEVLFPPELSEHPLATNHRRIYFGKKR